MSDVELRCPDIGNFKDVAIIAVLVKPGDAVEPDTPLLTLETDKATIDVPASQSGTITQVLVEVGGRASQGTPLVRMAPAAAAPEATVAAPSENRGAVAASDAARSVQVLVLGAGPGGYTAAFRAADLGLQVLLVERWPTLGGVCLNVGCIPSKALLHAAKVIDEAGAMSEHGVRFSKPDIDLEKLRSWKNRVVGKLTGGLAGLARQRKVEVVHGTARFVAPHVIEVKHEGQSQRIRFEHCIVAAGSEPIRLPFLPQDPRIIDSTGALELRRTDGRLLVIGGGIIGLEMACVYEALGARVSVVELTSQLIPGCDADLVKPLEKRLKARYEQVLLNTRVTAVRAEADGIHVTFEDAQGSTTQVFQQVLSAVGRTPNGRVLNAEAAGLNVDQRGFIAVDRQMRTNVPHIFAIGDIVGQPMLAHKATHEGRVAAEVIAGKKSFFDARVIPSVAYTDPEVAWVGLTEMAAKAQGLTVEKGVFPWAASGRSLALGRDDGFTKLLIDPATHHVVGGGIVGPNAGELIAEIALAIEMGAVAADVGLTIHPHPTLSESVGFAAEAWEGTLTDLYLPKQRG